MSEFDEKITSPIKAIRKFCIECCGGSPSEVRECPSKRCALHDFRFGKNPYIKREMTDAQKEEIAKRLNAARNR